MSKGIRLENYDSSIKKLYAAAIDPTLWGDAFRTIEDLTGSAGATLNFVSTTPSRQGLVLSGRLSEESCAEYSRDYMTICPRIACAIRQDGRNIIYDSMVLSEREMDRDPVYDWYGKQGLRYFIGSNMPPVDGYLINFSLQRTRQQGHVQAEDITLYRQLKDHVAQAITIAANLGSLNGRQSLIGTVLDRLLQGVVMVGRGGDILFANSAADRILARGQGMRAHRNVLEITPPNDPKRFARLIRGATSITHDEFDGRGGWLSLERGESLSPLSLFISPVVVDFGFPFSARPVALIFIHDRDKQAAKAVTMLRDLFDLTSAEARLAALLGHGVVLEEAAAQLRTATGTARNHLKSVFAKMGVHRQQDLVHLVTGLTAQGLAGPEDHAAERN
ncbi:helix-turn-helix transcriptional regulator [Rhizorhapis suberifaciens]|uniref:DNA-binding CsgD family transcriptional regulator n=1 Tax=Rhizorhapis suberifaciens TaxID=13656 RepID=A0A840HY88_9SPHN|nr:hypothetical protein [Rhizorhapis suberifaciens]MBB4642529.1 DNA-binding CsgD family transcriptional regulator [Rhizorhapis suberifaciens]